MFEKEAKEYTHTKHCEKKCGTGHCEKKCILVKDDYETFKDGAEFGYEKANEWHYPSKGEYPKVKAWVIGLYYGKDNWHKVFYRADGNWWGEGQLCQPPFAWKEIVPPKTEVSE